MNIRRFFAISDLHLEFYPKVQTFLSFLKPRLPPADVLILAGDIGYPNAQLETALTFFKENYPHVLYVPGNHEYYRCFRFDRNVQFQKLQEISERTGVELLEKKTVQIGNYQFLGTTLWSAIDLRATQGLADFNDAFENQFDYLGECVDSYRWLQSELAKPLEPEIKSRIVITHHLPTFSLIHPKYAKSELNSGFASKIFETLPTRSVSHWICGHSHECNELKIRNTRLILNPFGYPEENRSTQTSFKSFLFESEPDEEKTTEEIEEVDWEKSFQLYDSIENI